MKPHTTRTAHCLISSFAPPLAAVDGVPEGVPDRVLPVPSASGESRVSVGLVDDETPSTTIPEGAAEISCPEIVVPDSPTVNVTAPTAKTPARRISRIRAPRPSPASRWQRPPKAATTSSAARSTPCAPWTTAQSARRRSARRLAIEGGSGADPPPGNEISGAPLPPPHAARGFRARRFALRAGPQPRLPLRA